MREGTEFPAGCGPCGWTAAGVSGAAVAEGAATELRENLHTGELVSSGAYAAATLGMLLPFLLRCT